MAMPFVRPLEGLPSAWLRAFRRRRRLDENRLNPPLLPIAICVVAAVLGVGSAWLAIDANMGLERTSIGVWSTWSEAGRAGSDPYLRAAVARSGEFVLSSDEGVALTARTDESGAALRSRCVYRIAGKMPAAQWWTLTAYRDRDRSLMDTPTGRTSFRSDLVLREPDDSVVITMSPRARGGNWLPVDPDAGPIRLVLRLYDTPLATGGKLTDTDMPRVEQVSCG